MSEVTRRFGCWAGCPEGKPEDPERCCEESQDKVSRLFHQCYRKRGHGKDGLYCKQHAKWHPADQEQVTRRGDGNSDQ